MGVWRRDLAWVRCVLASSASEKRSGRGMDADTHALQPYQRASMALMWAQE